MLERTNAHVHTHIHANEMKITERILCHTSSSHIDVTVIQKKKRIL